MQEVQMWNVLIKTLHSSRDTNLSQEQEKNKWMIKFWRDTGSFGYRDGKVRLLGAQRFRKIGFSLLKAKGTLLSAFCVKILWAVWTKFGSCELFAWEKKCFRCLKAFQQQKMQKSFSQNQMWTGFRPHWEERMYFRKPFCTKTVVSQNSVLLSNEAITKLQKPRHSSVVKTALFQKATDAELNGDSEIVSIPTLTITHL